MDLPHRDLAYFQEGSAHFAEYVMAVGWAQEYARVDRELMMQREQHFGASVLITRKDAVSAQRGQLGIIPGTMGARSFIVRGLGNPESYCSCSHDAGRTMSRNEARRRFTVEDQARATAHVEYRTHADVIDEMAMAYKDIDAVMHAQRALVEIVHRLHQVVCVKG